MSNLFTTLLVFSLIAVIIEQLLPDNKISSLIKPVIFCSVIVCFLSTIKNFDYKTGSDGLFYNNEDNIEKVWKLAEQNCEMALEENMDKLCKDNNLSIEEVNVDVSTDLKSFEIERVHIKGFDSESAKNLISSFYSISKEYIITGG